MKSFNFLKPLNKLHKNKGVLYVLFALSLLVVLTYLSMSQLYPVLIFAIVTLVLKCYTNNMIIVLLSGILSTMLYSAYTCVKEGMTNADENKTDTSDESENETKDNVKCSPYDATCVKENMRPLKPKLLDDNDDSPYVDTASTLGVAYKNFEF